jgi:antirestriction protein
MENKIYVGTYYKYNNGSISGAWIDLENLTKDEFNQKCKELHKDETDPEFMYQDFECDEIFKGMISECGIDEEFWELKETLENTEIDLEALTAYKSIFGEIDIQDFEDKFYGHFEGYNIDKEFGEHILEELGELEQVPQHLRYYIDAEAYGRDLLINDFCEFNGFIFRNC